MIIAYTGTADFQEFSKADFKKAGIEDAKALRFAQGEPVEVDDELGEALTDSEGIFGDHSFTNLDDVEEGDTDEQTLENQREVAEKATKRTTRKASSTSDAGGPSTSGKTATTASTSDAGSTDSGPRSTGKGTSTSGTTGGSTRGSAR